MAIFVAALIVSVAVAASAATVVAELRRGRDERRRSCELSLVALFAPAIAASRDDPRVLLAWYPLAKTLRARFASEFAALDAASGSTFPFSTELLSSAHARWTTDWLAWEKAHDSTYKLKALVARQELDVGALSELGRAKLDAVEGEKLGLYQRRYEDYVRVGKALQGLIA